MAIQWSNWSGSQQHLAERFEQPGSEEQLCLLMEMAATSGRKIRAIGSAHSFVPFWTDDFLISLDNMKGLVECDKDTQQATFWAGTKLHEMGDVLWEHGLSMENMGDIDRQSIAGAVSTGTHGTGQTLQNIPSQLASLRMARADGHILDIDSGNDELFRAAQVSLGSLGVITQATFNLLPAYYLHEKNWAASVDECAGQREALIEENRHWEFFWDPASDTCAMKTLNMTDREEEVQLNDNEVIGRNYRIIPSDREIKFNEIEFSVPADVGWACFLEIRNLMKTKFPDVRWPIEYRTLKKDDMLLSSASGRESVTISAHEGRKYPFESFFLAVEEVFGRYDGRPHWGKIHTRQASDLRRLLPQFDRFCQIRAQFDPEGRFLNSFLQGIFGIN